MSIDCTLIRAPKNRSCWDWLLRRHPQYAVVWTSGAFVERRIRDITSGQITVAKTVLLQMIRASAKYDTERVKQILESLEWQPDSDQPLNAKIVAMWLDLVPYVAELDPPAASDVAQAVEQANAAVELRSLTPSPSADFDKIEPTNSNKPTPATARVFSRPQSYIEHYRGQIEDPR